MPAPSLPPPRVARDAIAWAAQTASPAPPPGDAADPLERAALARCGAAEEGLVAVARAVAREKLRTGRLPDPAWTDFVQRAAGEPHPWPRVWAASGGALPARETLAELDAWLAAAGDPRARRCGAAAAAGPGGARVLAVVAVDALADMAPLPIRGRTGQWLTIDARLRAGARGGEVIVLGPSGLPRRVPAWYGGASLRASFALDAPGETAVQVIADTASGPRPVLEASVFADVAPPDRPPGDAAPGETAAGDPAGAPGDGGAALAAMLDAARASAGLPPLARDARLDLAASRHALRMAAVQQLAHDAGDGSPADRMRDAGVDPRAEGENVARAATVAAAHRALWASPSHRANILSRAFARVGLAVARDARGDAWVVEDFAR